MSFDIDIVIVAVFLLTTLVVGIHKGSKIRNIREFAIGNRNFTTTALVCTIVATWAEGGDFFVFIEEAYSNGLYFIFADVFGILVVLLIVGLVFVPRMAEFLESLSIAEAMGRLYGNKARLITAIAGCIGTSGMIATQFKISGILFEHCFGISGLYGIIIGALIVTSYSAFGGIKSVTFTDVIQFCMFGVIIPTLTFFIFSTLDSTSQMMEVFSSNDNFDYTQIFDFGTKRSLYYLFLFFFIAVPSFDPAIFQRISMAKNTFQARKAVIIAAFAYFSVALMISWIGVIAVSIYPGMEASKVATRILTDYSYTGLKGLTLAGILAMMMSTADSYINSTSILFTHDFCKAAGIKIKNELVVSRIVAFGLGGFALILALNSTNLLKLLITTKSFYMPIVSVPFIFSVFGFRSSGKSVLIGMGAGFITVVLWEIFLRGHTVDSIIPGMAANIIFLFVSHYFLKQPGGWVGIKDYSPVMKLRQERKERFSQIVYAIKNFNFIRFCEKNSPKQDSVYLNFGIFCMFSTYFSIYTMPQSAKINYQELINFIYPSVFFVATALISYPIWIEPLKKTRIISVIWVAAVFYILVCVGSIQVLIGNFSKFQLMTFMLNFVVLAILTRWPVAMFMMIAGLLFSVQFFKWYSGIEIFVGKLNNLQFTIAYLLLFTSAILVAFLKPKQQYLEATEQKVDTLETEVIHYNQRISDQEKEIERLGATAQKILNNVNHELRLPIGNVVNFAEMLNEGLEKYSKSQLKELSDEVLKNSTRLSSMILNMLDLATLSARTIELQKKTVNFSELVEERVKTCRNIYLQKKKIDFELSIAQNLLIDVDPNYIRQTVDNLVINAITFSEKGVIKISVTKQQNVAVFVITNEGKPIPHTELHDIFTAFRMASNTESKAEGRGVGLALCKAAIEAHGGMIKAENTGKGAKFRFVLPL